MEGTHRKITAVHKCTGLCGVKRSAVWGGLTMEVTGIRPTISSRFRRASIWLSLNNVQTQNPPDNIRSKMNSATDKKQRRRVASPPWAAQELVGGFLSTPPADDDFCSLSSTSEFGVRRWVSVSATTAAIMTRVSACHDTDDVHFELYRAYTSSDYFTWTESASNQIITVTGVLWKSTNYMAIRIICSEFCLYKAIESATSAMQILQVTVPIQSPAASRESTSVSSSDTSYDEARHKIAANLIRHCPRDAHSTSTWRRRLHYY